MTQQGNQHWRSFFIAWFLLCAALNVVMAFGFCGWFAAFQARVLPDGDAQALLGACRAAWRDRWFTPRYAVFVVAGLGVAWALWRRPNVGFVLAQWYLLVGILLRFMFNVFPRTGPDAGLFPLPPGTSTDPPVYLAPVGAGVITGFIQITVFCLLLLQRLPRRRTPAPHPADASAAGLN